MTAAGRSWRGWLAGRIGHAGPLRRLGGVDVVFIGDSITQFWLDEDPIFFLGSRANVGISGETTAAMLARFERDVLAPRPRVAHIMGGTNDVWHGVPGDDAALAIANLAAMARLARRAGIAVVLAAPPPVAPEAEPLFRHPELLAPIRRAIVAIARAEDAVPVDYATSLRDAGGELAPAFTTDGVHLTRAGYLAMRRQANDAVKAALRSARASSGRRSTLWRARAEAGSEDR